MDNGFLIFVLVWFSLMFLAGLHRRNLRSKIVKRMIEEEYTASEIEKALKAYDGEED